MERPYDKDIELLMGDLNVSSLWITSAIRQLVRLKKVFYNITFYYYYYIFIKI